MGTEGVSVVTLKSCTEIHVFSFAQRRSRLCQANSSAIEFVIVNGRIWFMRAANHIVIHW